MQFWSALLVVYSLLVLYSLLRVPVPGVNEPHYLCKAKHYWNPSWCSGDLFLSSSNPHLVFYSAFGGLTTFLSLEATAIVSRIIGLLPLAIGWQFLSFRLTGRQSTAVVALSLLLVIQSAGNWSGEWLVGGMESKVVAYGFLFWSIAQAMSLKIPSSAVLAGLSISFHPVVGVWGVVATVMATGLYVLRTDCSANWSKIPSWRVWGMATLLFLITALPGLVSAGGAVFEGDPEATRIANLLQVGHRLAHHLDPLKFSKESYRYLTALILFWLLLTPGTMHQQRSRWWNLLILSSLLIAGVGILLGWGPRPLKEMPGYEWRITALKFYPFRLADLIVPVALSLVAAQRMVIGLQQRISHSSWRGVLFVTFIAGLTWIGIVIPGTDRNPSGMSTAKRENWIAACRWIDENSSVKDLVLSFDNQWAVKWYTQRPEYVNYKDCPQDAKSIIAWNERRWVISRWRERAFQDGRVTPEELEALAEQTRVSIFICNKLGPIDKEPAYRNKDFRVYRMSLKAEAKEHSGAERHTL